MNPQRHSDGLLPRNFSGAEFPPLLDIGNWELLFDGAEGPRLEWSAETYRIAGYHPGAVEVTIGLFFSLVPLEDHSGIRRAISLSFRNGAPCSFVHRLIRPSGSERIIHETARAILDPNSGEVTRIIGTCHDITEKRLAELALKASEYQFASAFENAAIGMALVALDGSFIRVNLAFAGMLGYGEVELLTKNFQDITHPEDLDADVENVRQLLAGNGTTYQMEKRYLHRLGHVVWVLLSVSLTRDLAAQPVQFISQMQDISQRKQTENKIREQATLLDKARDAILVRDLDHRVVYWNRSAQRLYGWNQDEVNGLSIKDILYRDNETFLAATRATMENGEWAGEIEPWTKDGDRRIVESHWSLVLDDHGTPHSILSIDTDITERKKMEQQFLRAQRIESIGTLAGGIAHDLNNVLAPIMMSIDLLRTYVTNPRAKEILDLVGDSAQRGAKMVSQVLTFAKGAEGRAVEVKISEVTRDVIRIIEETFPKDIRITYSLEPDLLDVRGDATQIHQVLLNLCVNARDAMPGGGQLSIHAKNVVVDEHYAAMNFEANPGRYLKIEIEDTGHGIPAEIIEKLFDPFFTTKEPGKGTGLGLSTSLAIVKSHGGFIRLYSEPGSGALFRLYLPALAKAGSPTNVDPEPIDLPRGNGELILVVDDEHAIREICCQTLESYGYRVLLAGNGSEALLAYMKKGDEVSMVLTDMMMPVMGGATTMQGLKRINPEVKIICSSGIGSNGTIAAEHGNHFLQKPFTAETLLKAIRLRLDQR